MSDSMPPGTAYVCPRCNTQAEFVRQSKAVTETRCPRCQVTLGIAFDHTAPLISEGSEDD